MNGGDYVFIGLCVCVCVFACSKLANQTFGVLNDNSSKMVNATGLMFDAHVFKGQAVHDPLKFMEKRVSPWSRDLHISIK